MLPTARSKAEEQRNALRKRDKRSLKEKKRALQESTENRAQLLARRLAHDAAAKAPGKDATDKSKPPLRLPKVHRPPT